jgi:hypothetical protein
LKLNDIELLAEAKRINISVHELIKRKIGYRKCKKREMDCRFCENLRLLGQINKTMNCSVIGESLDPWAIVDQYHYAGNIIQ